MGSKTVVTIGNFDGVHRGHRELLRRARTLAGPGGRVVALVFCPHPITVLRPDRAPELLMDFPRRCETLTACDVDHIEQLTPTAEFLSQSAQAFIEHVVERHQPDVFVEGEDFHFGRGREGNVARLAEFGQRMGFEVEVVEPQTVDLFDQSVVVASSSLLRWLVANGRMADAARVLGRPYELDGIVVQGDRRGRDLGFPTANLDTPCLLPKDGVYAGIAHLPDGRAMATALHVGERATFNDTRRTVEGYILDWDGPLAEGTAEYGWPLRYDVLAWLRGQVGFESVPALVDQIRHDVEETRHAVQRSERGRLTGTFASAES